MSDKLAVIDAPGQLAPTGNATAIAAASQARAEVEARYVMALRMPRDINDVRVRLLRTCERPASNCSSLSDRLPISIPIGLGRRLAIHPTMAIS